MNTHKLLLAFIDAMGCQVQEVKDYKEEKVIEQDAWDIRTGASGDFRTLKVIDGEWEIDSNGCYTSMLMNPPVTDYKVNKKPDADDGCMTIDKSVLFNDKQWKAIGGGLVDDDIVSISGKYSGKYSMVADMGDKVKLKRITE